MKKLFESHPVAGSFMGCSMVVAGVFGLKIVTDFVFNMTVLFVDHNGNSSESGEISVEDNRCFEEE